LIGNPAYVVWIDFKQSIGGVGVDY